ncbi:RICIN domain-containing protein [Streptomyces sp. SID12501]|uniref:Ricin-type beta-trefoil lectin domain protein n=1 Tax=Streptomyces sp. SID12501 TaxID=2706042 RepID=A0A6B3BYU7_9ACTN|nr:RICIN domain-containing protein [Streptomyces sp. SID12501]NEC89571.1 ricin-type beta-trefoil lectin domain protein [Streptomyces sp. SID12501]
MSQDTDHSGVDGADGVYVGASDAHLTELLRTNSPTAYPALQELRARHRASVLAYARLCTTSDSTAGQLAAQAFTAAARDTARGIEPSVPWRHQLLLLTADLAATWATDERAAGLDPSLLLVLNTLSPMNAGSAPNAVGEVGLIPPPPMLAPFQSLPSRTRGLIWYGIVEREPEDRTAALLGLTRQDVTHETDSALQALAQACLRFRLAVSADPRCQDFRRLIEESVRPVNPRHSTDLNSHMVICPHCSMAYEELSALRDNPRRALGEGLLPWSGLSYARDAPTVTRANSLPSEGSWPWTPARPSRRRFVLASAVLGVTLVPLLIVLLSRSGGPPDTQGAAGTLPVTAVPSVPGATSPSSPAAADSPSPGPTSRPRTTPTPSPSPTPKPTPTPTPTPTPAFRAPGASFAQVVNVASGRCLDIRGGELEKGTDVVTATCSASAATQRWQVDAGSGLLRSSANTDLCLDSRGDVDKGVGIWECASVGDSENGDNLRFTVDDDGVIRPAIAIATALTPSGDGGLTLEPLTGGSGQRWRAGAS